MIISNEIGMAIMQLYLKKLWLKLDNIQKIEGNSSIGGDSFPKGVDISEHANMQTYSWNCLTLMVSRTSKGVHLNSLSAIVVLFI